MRSFKRRISGASEDILSRLDRPLGFRVCTLALLPITLLLLLPVGWNDNEEMYFLFAHKSVEPAAFGPYSAVFDDSSYRFLSNWVLGAPIVIFGYEAAQMSARIFMATLYALGLGAFFSALRLSWLDAVAVLAVFVMAGQNLFAGEWLFDGVEGKTFAYAAVLGAIGLGLRDRWGPALALAVLAIYFHFLVGGFWGVVLIALSALRDRSLGRSLRLIGLMVLSASPIVLLIALERLGGGDVLPDSSVNPDVIYSSIRNAHHVAPFASIGIIISWSKGLIAAAALFIALIVAIRHARDPILYTLVAAILIYLFLALAIAYLDRETYFFGKFYLFRPASLVLLMAITLGAASLRDADLTVAFKSHPKIVPARMLISAVIAVVFISGQIQQKTKLWIDKTETSLDFAPMIAAVKRESSEGEIVLLQPDSFTSGSQHFALHRLFSRPTLVSFKFIPTSDQAILRWYYLIEFQKKLFTEGCTDHLPYPIKLLAVFDDETLQKVKSCGPVVWRGSTGALIKIEE